MNKYQINDKVFILYQNRIVRVSIHEIRIKKEGIYYILFFFEYKEDERKPVFLELRESNCHKTIDDLITSLVDEWEQTVIEFEETT